MRSWRRPRRADISVAPIEDVTLLDDPGGRRRRQQHGAPARADGDRGKGELTSKVLESGCRAARRAPPEPTRPERVVPEAKIRDGPGSRAQAPRRDGGLKRAEGHRPPAGGAKVGGGQRSAVRRCAATGMSRRRTTCRGCGKRRPSSCSSSSSSSRPSRRSCSRRSRESSPHRSPLETHEGGPRGRGESELELAEALLRVLRRRRPSSFDRWRSSSTAVSIERVKVETLDTMDTRARG